MFECLCTVVLCGSALEACAGVNCAALHSLVWSLINHKRHITTGRRAALDDVFVRWFKKAARSGSMLQLDDMDALKKQSTLASVCELGHADVLNALLAAPRIAQLVKGSMDEMWKAAAYVSVLYFHCDSCHTHWLLTLQTAARRMRPLSCLYC